MDTTFPQPTTRELGGLAADDYGQADDRRPLVLLHGLTFDRTIWAGLVAQLHAVDPGRRVVAIDLPGHGRSPARPSYELTDCSAQLHRAIIEADLASPVVVGHSAGAILATVYASRYPAGGVVNVDQPLRHEAFSGLLRSLAPRLRSPEFPAMWEMFFAGFHTELLSPEVQQLVRSTCRPRQDVVLGYWRQLIESPVAETTSLIDSTTEALREKGLPYLQINGAEAQADYPQWLADRLPTARIDVWPASGHFPHLANPTRFAERLAATAGWPSSHLARNS